MASTITRSQSNRASLGGGITGVLHQVKQQVSSHCSKAIMSTWTNICFQHLLESNPEIINAVLKVKRCLSNNKVYPVKKLVYFGVMNEKRNKDCFLVVLEPLEGV